MRTAKDVDPNKHGAHGYDYIQPDMHSVMFARGPSFKEKVVLPPYINVEYMNLWIKLLQLPAQENDGEPDFMNMALISGEAALKPRYSPLRRCDTTTAWLRQSLTPDAVCGNCTRKDEEQFEKWLRLSGPSAAVTITSDVREFCQIGACNGLAVIDTSRKHAFFATLAEMYDKNKNEESFSSECTFHIANRSDPCKRPNIAEKVEYRTLSAYPGRVLANEFSLITPWKPNFIKAILDPLNNYTRKIVEKLGRVLSITGTAYDEDYDGKHSGSAPNSPYPTHLYRILIACDGIWDAYNCLKPDQTKVLSFIFPHMDGDPNCLTEEKLLLQYTARIKDVESITGLYFNFTEIPEQQQMLLKMKISIDLW